MPDDGNWETRTEGDSTYESSAVSGSSFDSANPNERNSRRALILQMAKARMKNAKLGNNAAEKVGAEADADETVAKQQQDNCSLAEQAAHLELD